MILTVPGLNANCVRARGGGGSGSRQREVADGADVVFTDSDRWGFLVLGIRLKINRQKLKHFNFYVKVKILLTQL